MPLWGPFLKASLPIVTHIVSAAVPAFTSKPQEVKVDPVVVKQIEELQTAVTNNAESIHVLAEKFRETIEGLDNASILLQQEMARLKVMLYASTATAAAALLLCAILFLR